MTEKAIFHFSRNRYDRQSFFGLFLEHFEGSFTNFWSIFWLHATKIGLHNLQADKNCPPPGYDRFTDQPINRPINRYRPINRIGQYEKWPYRQDIGIGRFWSSYRHIGRPPNQVL